MSRNIRKKMNDGNMTGLNQDRYRNSRFEYEEDWKSHRPYSGVTSKSLNTLGGVYAENRGRRSADDSLERDDNPFENGKLHNWNHRQGWDRYFDRSYDKEGNRPHGGALVGHDGGHRGKGPKGYKRADESIYDDVCQMLTLSPDVDARDIEVTVNEGIVRLDGAVESRQTKRMAELAVENISGVVDVQNMLSFRQNEGVPSGKRPEEAREEDRH